MSWPRCGTGMIQSLSSRMRMSLSVCLSAWHRCRLDLRSAFGNGRRFLPDRLSHVIDGNRTLPHRDDTHIRPSTKSIIKTRVGILVVGIVGLLFVLYTVCVSYSSLVFDPHSTLPSPGSASLSDSHSHSVIRPSESQSSTSQSLTDSDRSVLLGTSREKQSNTGPGQSVEPIDMTMTTRPPSQSDVGGDDLDRAAQQADAAAAAGSTLTGSHVQVSGQQAERALLAELLCIIISASRPSRQDFLSPLSAVLLPIVGRIVVLDADKNDAASGSTGTGRSFPFAHTILHVPDERINAKIDVARRDARNDKHRDPVERIVWRSTAALHYAYALEYAYMQRDSYSHVMILEDDAWPADDVGQRMQSILRQPPPGESHSTWLAYALFHCANYDARPSYRHGERYEYKACTQAILYRSSLVQPLVSYIKANYREDPIDWIIRNYQYDTNGEIRVSIPSLFQHAGLGASTLLAKGKKQDVNQGCHAFDFEQPTALPTKEEMDKAAQDGPLHKGMQTRILLNRDDIPPDPKPRDRWK